MALSNPRFSSNAQLVAAAENRLPMRRGAQGEGVAILQQALLDLGFPMPRTTRARGGLPDGIFGAETEGAVQAFQRQHRLLADGVAGRITLGRLETSIQQLSEAEDATFKSRFASASHKGSLFA
jgi:peptidoglycan hydrolase-like protein with peptidoglycan-binding domain